MLVLLACGLVVLPAPVQERPGSFTEADFAPAKSETRFRVRSMRKAMVWLREITIRLSEDPDFKVDTRSLHMAIALLGGDEITQLLDNPDHWPKPPFPDGSWARWKQLAPLREALLERLGGLDPALGLKRFPAGAQLILRAAAAIDGPGTLTLWLESREAWRSADRSPLIDNMCQWIEGVGEVPTIAPEKDEEENTVGASLLEGWASQDAAAAWRAIDGVSGEFCSATELCGFVSGLPDGSAWADWAAKLLPVRWQVAEHGFDAGTTNPILALAKRWVKEEPAQALDWLNVQQPKWDEELKSADSFDFLFWRGRIPFWRGTSGHTEYLPVEVFVLADWIEAHPQDAFEWLDANSVDDDILAELVGWSKWPESTKEELIRRRADSGRRGRPPEESAPAEDPDPAPSPGE